MRKHLPNILLLAVVLVNLYFMAMYIRNNDLGKFLSTTGTGLLILGILIFIFFLSIDPGYGWIKSMDLTRNYILIFVSMAVGISGIVLIISGQRMHGIRVKALADESRCQEIMNGNAVHILEDDWFSLRDQQKEPPISVYLFQNKGNRNIYRIIATINKDRNSTQTLEKLIITSDALPSELVFKNQQSLCPQVMEQDIRIDYTRHEKLDEHVSFSLTVVVQEKWATDEAGAVRTKNVRFTLKNTQPASGINQGSSGRRDESKPLIKSLLALFKNAQDNNSTVTN